MLAAVCMGLFPNVNEAVEAMVSQTFYVEPLKENAEIYAQFYQKYKQVKMKLGEISEILI
jgi:ribulose kinase